MRGDVEAGFRQADIVIEREFRTRPIHQSYIEPQGCVASASEDGQVEVWCCTQGPFVVRAQIAGVLQARCGESPRHALRARRRFRRQDHVYAEAVAIAAVAQGEPAGEDRADAQRGVPLHRSGAGAWARIKIGATKDGKITAAEAEMAVQAGAFFAGSLFRNAPMAVFTRYDLPNARTVGLRGGVATGRRWTRSARRTCPQCTFAAESVIDELATKLGIDPIDFRLKNVMRDGCTTIYGEKFGPIGAAAVLEAVKTSDHYRSPLAARSGPRRRLRLLVQPRRRDHRPR